ncbi:protein ARV 1-like isoform X2 [Pyrus x bretschneideri]|uniref:protein ARV 1-like isoform X2 n=1 Tax=Pyrus x bretschneideri TaxID=225117 RepID=UPI00202EF871|nr:protein ARV 1-like isoform X2 [Pyrus x bretschneideri]
MTTLFVHYSPGNIRLMKCGNFKAVADEYIECEPIVKLLFFFFNFFPSKFNKFVTFFCCLHCQIIPIDSILHKTKAYTHLLYNVIDPQAPSFQSLMWKSTFGFLLLDACRSLFLEGSKEEWGLSMSFALLLWRFQKMLMDVVFGNIMFLSTFVLAMRILFSTFPRPLSDNSVTYE